MIFIGHSVGAYILLETVRLLNLRRKEKIENGEVVDVDVVGGILLFPTIQDIALSKSGKIVTVCYLSFSSTCYQSPDIHRKLLYFAY